MTLAQVVYKMSTDNDFASELLSNPESTLQDRGLELSKEELAFLLSAPYRGDQEKTRIVDLSIAQASSWNG